MVAEPLQRRVREDRGVRAAGGKLADILADERDPRAQFRIERGAQFVGSVDHRGRRIDAVRVAARAARQLDRMLACSASEIDDSLAGAARKTETGEDQFDRLGAIAPEAMIKLGFPISHRIDSDFERFVRAYGAAGLRTSAGGGKMVVDSRVKPENDVFYRPRPRPSRGRASFPSWPGLTRPSTLRYLRSSDERRMGLHYDRSPQRRALHRRDFQYRPPRMGAS